MTEPPHPHIKSKYHILLIPHPARSSGETVHFIQRGSSRPSPIVLCLPSIDSLSRVLLLSLYYGFSFMLLADRRSTFTPSLRL